MTTTTRELAAAAAVLALAAAVGASPPQRRTVFLSSPAYNIDLSLTMTGKCAPAEGSDFKHLDLYGGFKGVRFAGSGPAGRPISMQGADGIAGHQVGGRGEIREFDLCPAWEDETHAIPAKVTKGPSPFRVSLTVLTEAEARERLDNPHDPMTPKDLLPVAWLEFSTRFSILGQELAWEHPGLSKMGISDYSFVFSVSLDALGKGQSFAFTLPHTGEGEAGTWSVMFTPSPAR